MQHLRERELAELDARLAAERANPPPWLDITTCPEGAEIMQMALGNAPADLVARLQQHMERCEVCRVRLECFHRVIRDEEVIEPPLEGSLGEWLCQELEELE